MTNTSRRDFLRMLACGAATTTAGLILPASVVALERERRVWQVPRSAPVRTVFDYEEQWPLTPASISPYEAMILAHVRAEFARRIRSEYRYVLPTPEDVRRLALGLFRDDDFFAAISVSEQDGALCIELPNRFAVHCKQVSISR